MGGEGEVVGEVGGGDRERERGGEKLERREREEREWKGEVRW